MTAILTDTRDWLVVSPWGFTGALVVVIAAIGGLRAWIRRGSL